LFLGVGSLHSFTRLYDNFNRLPMNHAKKLVPLPNTYRNGWEYFIQEINKRKLLSS
jgi:hypothetical protein